MNRTDAYSEVIRFHGHECPGAAFGLRVAEAAVARLGRHTGDNDLIAVAETDACAVDAVQVITGCTFGKRNLQYEDYGKNAFTFWRISDGTGVRIQARPDGVAFRTAEIWALARKKEAGTATAEEAKRFGSLQEERTRRLLELPEDEVLVIEEVEGDVPFRKAQHSFAPCERCGEPASVERLHYHRNRMLCPTCHLEAHDGKLPADHGGSHHHH
jgi:formylmethanofuran dehydrogenase subunit E